MLGSLSIYKIQFFVGNRYYINNKAQFHQIRHLCNYKTDDYKYEKYWYSLDYSQNFD